MEKIPYIRQGQEFDRDTLNKIIKAVNTTSIERPEYAKMMDDIALLSNNLRSRMDSFIARFNDIVENTPGMMELLREYNDLAKVVSGNYVANVDSISLDISIDKTVESLSGITDVESGHFVTYNNELYVNVGTKEASNFVKLNNVLGPQGPQGPQGIPGINGADGEKGERGALCNIRYVQNENDPGYLTSVDGEGNLSLINYANELTDLALNDAFFVKTKLNESGTNYTVDLYIYVREPINNEAINSGNFIKVNNLRGPEGPAGKNAVVDFEYANANEGPTSKNYDFQKFLVLKSNVGTENETKRYIRVAPYDIAFSSESELKEAKVDIPTIEFESGTDDTANYKKFFKAILSIPYIEKFSEMHIDENGNLVLTTKKGKEETSQTLGVVKGKDGNNIVVSRTVGDEDGSKVGDIVIDAADDFKVYKKKSSGAELFGQLKPNIAIDSETGKWKIDGFVTDIPATGPEGPTGPQGPQGIQGEQGPTGPAGTGVTILGTAEAGTLNPGTGTGAVGSVGTITINGSAVSGSAGDAYLVGSILAVWAGSAQNATLFKNVGAIQGPQGPKGDTGATGAAGAKGDKGDKGATGETGATGAQGRTPLIIFGTLFTVTSGSQNKSTDDEGLENCGAGDIYINNSTGGIYSLSVSGTTVSGQYMGSIKGKGISSISATKDSLTISYTDSTSQTFTFDALKAGSYEVSGIVWHDVNTSDSSKKGTITIKDAGSLYSILKSLISADHVLKDGTKVLSTNDYTTAEKEKLEGIPANANHFEHTTTTGVGAAFTKIGRDGFGHVVIGDAITKADITNLGIPAQDTTYSVATTSADGLMSKEDKAALDALSDDKIVSASLTLI